MENDGVILFIPSFFKLQKFPDIQQNKGKKILQFLNIYGRQFWQEYFRELRWFLEYNLFTKNFLYTIYYVV